MTKDEHIKRHGVKHYEKALLQSRDRNRENRDVIRAKRQLKMNNLSEKEKEAIRIRQRERMSVIREKDRAAYNAYHKKYYAENRAKILERNNAKRRNKNAR